MRLVKAACERQERSVSIVLLVANVNDGDPGFWSFARAASAGSLGQPNPQALVGQSPLPLLTPAFRLLPSVFDSTAESPDAALRLQH
jgi:hypothetical protein